MIETWLGSSWTEVWLVAVSTVAIFAVVIVYVRILGLRSFSKMSSFDFVMTVAVGSVVASTTATETVTLLNGAIALACLFAVQWTVARLRERLAFERIIDNSPRLLMVGDRYVHHNLRKARVTELDLQAKLREHGVLGFDQVQAVVMETTGEISVLADDRQVDSALLEGVIDAELLDEWRRDT